MLKYTLATTTTALFFLFNKDVVDAAALKEFNITSDDGTCVQASFRFIPRPPEPRDIDGDDEEEVEQPTGRLLAEGPGNQGFNLTCLTTIQEKCSPCFQNFDVGTDEFKRCVGMCIATNEDVQEKCDQITLPSPIVNATVADCKQIVGVACKTCSELADPIGRAVCLKKCFDRFEDFFDRIGCEAPAPEKNGTLSRCMNIVKDSCECGDEDDGERGTCKEACLEAKKQELIDAKCFFTRNSTARGFDESLLRRFRIVALGALKNKLPRGAVSITFVLGDRLMIEGTAQYPSKSNMNVSDPSDPDATTGESSMSFSLLQDTSSSALAQFESSVMNYVLVGMGSSFAAGAQSKSAAAAAMASAAAALTFNSFSSVDAQEDSPKCPIKVNVVITHRGFGPISNRGPNDRFKFDDDD